MTDDEGGRKVPRPERGTTPAGNGALAGAQPRPERIGEFEVRGVLGRGGMGTVYRAFQPSMQREIALKVLAPGLSLSGADVFRFEREAWLGGRLAHPNIVRVHAQGRAGDSHWLAMELVAGGSLADHLKQLREERKGQRPTDAAWTSTHVLRMVELFTGVADALEHCRQGGIIHRDLKPLNLLLARDGSRLLVTDFGIARDEDASRLTREGSLMGTIAYMAPEQLLASRIPIDHRSDIYALGVSLYEAVTLALPFDAASEEAYMAAVTMKDPLPARSRLAAIPRDLETVVMHCLERDADRRYQTAAELRDDLRRILANEPVRARRVGVVRRTARKAWRHRIAVGLGILGVLMGALAWRQIGMALEARRAATASHLQREQQRTHVKSVLAGAIARNEWSGLPREQLEDLLEDAPNGDPELQRLALQAMTRVKFALSKPYYEKGEPILLGVSPPPLTGRAILCEYAIAWDQGAWIPAHWVTKVTGPAACVNARTDIGGAQQPIDTLLPTSALTPLPHRLDVRARVRVTAASAWCGPDGTTLALSGQGLYAGPALADAEVLLDDTRRLPPLTVTIFAAFPDDFPPAVRSAPGDPDVPVKLGQVKIRRLRVPAGASRIRATTEPGVVSEIPVPSPWPAGAAAWLALEWEYILAASSPLAMQGTLTLGAGLQSSSLAWEVTDSYSSFAPRFDNKVTSTSSDTEPNVKHSGAYLVCFGDHVPTLRPFPFDLPDGVHVARLHLEPSRELARRAGYLTFLDATIEQSVEVEIVTVDPISFE